MESRIIEALDSGKIVLVTGIRGVGKTTLLRSVKAELERTRGKAAIAFQDLEDPRFSPRPRRETLELFGGKSRFIFLDEVGRVEGWLDWARKASKRLGAGIVASLSGPRADFDADDVYQIALYPQRITDMSVETEEYLRTGGLPGLAGQEDKRGSLVNLFNLCLFKDVVQRFQVRDIDKLTAIAVYLLTSTSRQISASRLKGLLCRSVDQARGFLGHLERSGLVHLVTRIEDARRTQARAARRCFSADCGLSVALSNREPGLRDLAETAVFHELLRQGHRVLAWRVRGRLGLAVAGESLPRLLIDVAYQDQRQDETRALNSAMGAHSCPLGLMLGDGQEDLTLAVANGTIVKKNFTKWLKEPELPGTVPVVQPVPVRRKPRRKADKPPAPEPPGLPRHLL